jgi:hypothetical protein
VSHITSLRLFLAVAVATSAALAFSLSASAQPGPPSPQGVEVARGDIGEGYAAAVYMRPERPVAGLVLFEVSVTRTGTGMAAEGLQVRLYAQPAQGGDLQTARALSTPDRSGLYTAKLEMDRAGIWGVQVDVSLSPDAPPLGRLEFDVEVRARARSSPALGTAVWALVTAAIVGGSVWLWYSSRKARRAAKS